MNVNICAEGLQTEAGDVDFIILDSNYMDYEAVKRSCFKDKFLSKVVTIKKTYKIYIVDITYRAIYN